MSVISKRQKAKPLNLKHALSKTKHLDNRTPTNSDHNDESSAYGFLSDFGNGGMYVANYTGFSEWERHSHGDEMVQVIEGETSLVLLIDNEEVPNKIKAGELLIVPHGVWHRFESPKGVKVLTITPQPTDHQIERPSD
ncbi:cupin domain-containing protein [Marinomonas sp. MED121]|uniref:cupin domain-containing protein n=1 Tax=Marinomonas sp. MED121 TaxID=314277 RepID=UPI0002F855A0|nr:cupin domain-containing protein [Marinomonas sp. MED121]